MALRSGCLPRIGRSAELADEDVMRIVFRKQPLALALCVVLAGCRTTTIALHDARPSSNALAQASRRAPPSPAEHPTRNGSADSIAARRSIAKASASVVDEATPAEVVQTSAEDIVPAPVPPAPGESPSQRLSIFQAVETALSLNPDLQAQRQAEPVAEGVLGVAQTYPFNPFVQVQATPFQHQKDAGPGAVYHYVLLMQQIQLAHQQDFREENAGALLNSTRWTVLQAQLLCVAQTERLYFTALYQRGLRDLAKVNAQNNQDVLTTLERQLEAGQATAADVAMVRLDARATQRQLQLAEANYQTALLDLKRQIGLPISTPIDLDGDLTTWNWRPVGDAAAAGETAIALPLSGSTVANVRSLAAGRPDVMAARSDIDAARANVCLADASRVPDLQIGPYYQRTADSTSFLGFRAQMDIPVLNNGVPLVRQRQAELQQRTAVWQQLQTRAELEAEAAVDRYQRALGLLSESDAIATSELPEALRRLEEQFKAGEVDVLRVFQARNSLIQHRRAILDTQNEVAQAAATVTAATGLPIEGLNGQ